MGPQGVLDAVAELGQDHVGDVVGELGHEEHADALGADEAHGLGDLVEELVAGVLEEQVGLVEEEDQLRLVEVAHLGQGLEELGQHPHEEGGEELRLGLDRGQLQAADDALVALDAQQIGDRELRLAEEGVAALALQLADRSQEHAGGGAGHPADGLQVGLALVPREVVEEVPEVGQVEQGQPVLVGIAEDQGQRGPLRLVRAEHLGQQLGAEGGHRRPHRHTRPDPAEGEEGHRARRRRPGDPQLGGPTGQAVVGRRGGRQAAQVALHVGGEDGHTDGRELFGHDLEADRLARAGRPGDQAMAVAHGGGDLHHGVGVGRALEHPPPEADHRPLGGVAGGDPGGEVSRGDRGYVGHRRGSVEAPGRCRRNRPTRSVHGQTREVVNRLTWAI